MLLSPGEGAAASSGGAGGGHRGCGSGDPLKARWIESFFLEAVLISVAWGME